MDKDDYENKISNGEAYIKKAEKFEKINKHKEAIEYYRKAINVIGNRDNIKSYKINMKLGALLRNVGEIDRCIEYYGISYEIAVKEDNIYFKIDSLNKLAMESFFKGEIDTSLNYINKSYNFLKEVDYTEGKLNYLIFWMNKYYYENEYYKAREAGNMALKLCGNEFLYYKGRILNSMAVLFTGILSSDEHIKLLNEALISFKKINYIPGILGVTNNIGGIYADKMQDSDKALNYFYKLGKKAKKENYDEFIIFSYLNMGEINLRSLNYDKAYLLYKKGLIEAENVKLTHIIFFSSIGLINTCLELNKYNEAYKYYKMANEEYLKNPEQGPMTPEYYKAVSLFNFKLGNIEEAKKYIKKSLGCQMIQKPVIVWNTELIYELIRIYDAENISDIKDSLGSIKGILAKYKNNEIIMDNIYNTSFQLIDKGYVDEAENLIKQYKNLKVKPCLKGLYIDAYIKDFNNRENLEELNKLKISAENTCINFKWKIYDLIGNYYYKRKAYCDAAKNYRIANNEAKKLIDSIPEEYRINYTKISLIKKTEIKLENLNI